MKRAVRYPNLRSRVLLGRLARTQPLQSAPLGRAAARFLDGYERRVLKVDLKGIVIDRPILLIGLPRSGTTVVQDLLCAHDRVAFLTHAMRRYLPWPCAAEDIRRRLRLDFETERFLGDSLPATAGAASDGVGLWNTLFPQEADSLEFKDFRAEDLPPGRVEAFRTLLRKILWSHGGRGRRFFSKLLGLFPHVLAVQDLFPDARFIHIIRDPRPAANSLLKLGRLLEEHGRGSRTPGNGGAGSVPYPRFPGLAAAARAHGLADIRTMAHLWNEAASFIRSVRPRLRALHEVRYEDLLARPEEEVARLLAFCELPQPAPDNVLFAKKLKEIGAVRHANAYGDYDVIERICGPLMKDFGYRDRMRPRAASTRRAGTRR